MAKDPRVSMRRRSGTLVIDIHSGGRPDDYEGEYQCFARNDYGTALSSKIHLQVSSESFLGSTTGPWEAWGEYPALKWLQVCPGVSRR